MRNWRIRASIGVIAAAVLGIGMSSASAAEPSSGAYWVFFGPYTGGKGAVVSKGIYRSRFDAKAGTLTEPELAAEVVNPTFLAIHPTKKFLYSVGEVAALDGKKGGGVHAFALDTNTGKLTPLNTAASIGAGPSHVIVNPAGNLITVSNYGGGSTVLFKLDPDGKIGAPAAFIQHTGPEGARKPHAHCGAFDKSGRFSMTADAGLDLIKVFKLDPATGAADDAAAADITMPPGSGPRHIALAPDAKTAYICGERDSTVNVVQLDLAGGKSEVIQSLSTLPSPVNRNFTAEVILHPSGQFVYVSNRGHNSIAVFKVEVGGKLTAGHITGDIKTPRNFNIDPSGQWMLIASEDGGKVGVWELDGKTGMGKETGRTVKIARAVCIKFVPVGK